MRQRIAPPVDVIGGQLLEHGVFFVAHRRKQTQRHIFYRNLFSGASRRRAGSGLRFAGRGGGRKRQEIRYRGTPVGVLEIAELFTVEPDRVELPRLEFHGGDTDAAIRQIARLTDEFGKVPLTPRGPGPTVVEHGFAEGDVNFCQCGIHIGCAGDGHGSNHHWWCGFERGGWRLREGGSGQHDETEDCEIEFHRRLVFHQFEPTPMTLGGKLVAASGIALVAITVGDASSLINRAAR